MGVTTGRSLERAKGRLQDDQKDEHKLMSPMWLSYTKLGCTLNGIHVSNYAPNECIRGLDGFYVLKIKYSAQDW